MIFMIQFKIQFMTVNAASMLRNVDSTLKKHCRNIEYPLNVMSEKCFTYVAIQYLKTLIQHLFNIT